MSVFSVNLRYLRVSLGLSQIQLAFNLSSTQRTISNWELGISEPSIDMILSLCRFFGVSADYLLGLTDC